MTTPEGPYRWDCQSGVDGGNYLVFYGPGGFEAWELDAAAITARLNQQHAEIERLREALQEICDRCKHAACDPLADIAREFNDTAIFAWSALKQEASER